jgi:hypothetical protein
MLQIRRFTAAATALLPIAGALLALSGASTQAQGACDAADISVLPAPIAPWKGVPLRVIVASEKSTDGEMSLVAPNGSVAAKANGIQGGPPYVWYAEVASPAAGTWHATVTSSRCGTVTRDIIVRDTPAPPLAGSPGVVWPVRAAWTRSTENLYAAWIEKLFDAPLDAEPSWANLRLVLRDKSRNMLFNYLGLGEDEIATPISPDCADLVYFLRA